MKIHKRVVMAGAAALALTAGMLVGGGTAAFAAVTPAWEPDTSALGTINFFDASGNAVTGGSLDDHPIAVYAAASGPGRAGDSLAQLKAFTPQPGVLPGLWSGDTLGGATAYPVVGAPANVAGLTVPVATGFNTDFSMNDYIGEFPNNSTVSGYQDLYELRLYTSGAGQGQGNSYYRIDIQVNTGAGTWSVVYPPAAVSTSTVVTANPVSPAAHGSSVTLTATVSPSGAAGAVEFKDGATDLGPGSYNAATGKATLTLTPADGSHTFNAAFTPTDATAYTASNGSLAYSVTPAGIPTNITISTNPASGVTAGASGNVNVTLTANVTATGLAGSVEFFDGATDLGSADTYTSATGVATKAVVLTAAGSPHLLVAHFTPSDSTYSPSTSMVDSFVVIPANYGTAGITLNAQDNTAPFAGSLSLQVAAGASVALTQVDPSTAAGHPVDVTIPGGHHHAYVFDGSLTGVSVVDTRPSESGWTVTGQASDFVNGATTISAKNLGWTPVLGTGGDAEGVIGLGATVNSVLQTLGSLGLSSINNLAVAAPGNGLGTANLGANLDLRIPDTSPQGLYSSTLTLTLISP
jgi:hypothetical protein